MCCPKAFTTQLPPLGLSDFQVWFVEDAHEGKPGEDVKETVPRKPSVGLGEGKQQRGPGRDLGTETGRALTQARAAPPASAGVSVSPRPQAG